MTNPVIRNLALNDQLETQGFARFQLLDQVGLASLQGAFDAHIAGNFQGFHATMFHAPAVRVAIDKSIKQNLHSHWQRHLHNLEPLYANFMVKEPDAASGMKLHQDWAYLDESNASSYAIWMPLLDLTEQNGALWVVPESHKIENFVRGPGLHSPFDAIEEELKEMAIPLYLKAGEAVIWHHRLAHFSPPNFSNKKRIAATMIMVPPNTTTLHYISDGGTDTQQVKKFKINSSFFMNYQIQEGVTDINCDEIFSYSFPSLTLEEFKERTNAKKVNHLGFKQRIAGLFKKITG